MACEALQTELNDLEQTIAVLQESGRNPTQLKRLLVQASKVKIALAACEKAAPVVDLDGRWEFGGIPGPVISVQGKGFTIDMSVYERPAAHGVFVDPSHIRVNFPDENGVIEEAALQAGRILKKGMFTIQQTPDLILWVNGTVWSKVMLTKPVPIA